MSLGLTIAREVTDAPRPDGAVDYLPFGVKTLKVVVKGAAEGDVFIRPKRVSPTAGEKFGYEDGEEAHHFIISWGGGAEDDCKVEANSQGDGYGYFLLHHIGKVDRDYCLTLEAIQHTKPTPTTATLTVKLTYPSGYADGWPAEKLMRFQWQERKPGLDGEADLSLQGIYTPYYVSRWWPDNRVTYNYIANTPKIRLHYCRRLAAGKNGQIIVYAAVPNNPTEKVLAVINGSLSYPLYDMRQVAAELYRFGDQTWALRIWFFWLDSEISGEDLGRYWLRESAELEEAHRGITSREQGGTAEKSWAESHEIPDAERVDIMFNDNLETLSGATDFHWHELWADPRRQTQVNYLQVEIMNTLPRNVLARWRDFKQALQSMINEDLIPRVMNGESPIVPHHIVMQDLRREGVLAADPRRLECHTPFLRNGILSARYVSTDVREG